MKILLNLATLKKGGGHNVGLNFIKCLLLFKYDLNNFHFVVAKNSLIEFELKKNKVSNLTLAPNNPLKRMFFEFFHGNRIIKNNKIDIIYTIFGIGLYPKNCKQVSGSADSNLFFPEINFWEHYSGISLIKKSIIDKYRIWALKKATAVVFENESMLNKSKELFNLKNTFYSKPSINLDFREDFLELPSISLDSKVGLFLCGWQKNKNYMLIPKLLHEFRNKGFKFQIVITAPKSDKESLNDFMHEIKSLGVEDMVILLGSVKQTQLKALYKKIDYVFLLSKLESFSNNIIESWFFEKILVISNEEWSNAICNDGALFVNRNKPLDIVNKILELENDIEKKSVIVEKANQILKSYPSIKEKVDLELNYLKSVYESY